MKQLTEEDVHWLLENASSVYNVNPQLAIGYGEIDSISCPPNDNIDNPVCIRFHVIPIFFRLSDLVGMEEVSDDKLGVYYTHQGLAFCGTPLWLQFCNERAFSLRDRQPESIIKGLRLMETYEASHNAYLDDIEYYEFPQRVVSVVSDDEGCSYGVELINGDLYSLTREQVEEATFNGEVWEIPDEHKIKMSFTREVTLNPWEV